MNLWNDSGLKWAPENESKPEIERNHLHHRDMSILVNYNTTSQWSQHTFLIWTKCPIWIKYFNFWVWFGFRSTFPSPISPEIHLFYLDLTLCPYETCMLGSLGKSVVIHRIGHNSMMQMFSFIFWFWFGFINSFPSRINPEIQLYYSDWTLCPYETCMLGSLGSSVVIH